MLRTSAYCAKIQSIFAYKHRSAVSALSFGNISNACRFAPSVALTAFFLLMSFLSKNTKCFHFSYSLRLILSSRYSVFKVRSAVFATAMGLSGLEPPTSRLSGVRSNRLSYKPRSMSKCADTWFSASGACTREQKSLWMHRRRSRGMTGCRPGIPKA